MTDGLKKAWAEMVQPLLRRPPRFQVAAVCYRDNAKGREVLLITSRDTGRWIVPKGWPIEGMKSPEAAVQEAWEEAGVTPVTKRVSPIGTFAYDKRLGGGYDAPVEAQVYKVKVERLSDDYPEVKQRRRAWFKPDEAANLVDEPELKEILRHI